MESSPSALSLICKENLGSLDNEDEEISADGYDSEHIQTILVRETLQRFDFSADSSIRRARLEGIQYILRKRDVFGFGCETAYVSVTYLDRFLSRRSISVEKCWAVRLLSMACLSLAAKMEENRAPELSEYCAEDFGCESSVIQRMELLVLNTLGWKMASITPFAFVNFFADKFSLPASALSTVMDLVLGAVRDHRIMSHRPSVIAAAATLVVLDQGLSKDALEIKISHLNSAHSFKLEDIISCYDQFQEMEIERLKARKGFESPEFSPIQLQSHGSSSAATAKRKLEFHQNDESIAKKIKP